MGNAKLDALSDKEHAWIADNLSRALTMAKKYGGDAEAATRPTLAGLDGLWSTWTVALRESGQNPNALINMVGVAFGQHLVDELGLSWVIASDEHGTDLAVHGPQGNVLVFPCNLVAKRWQSGESEFVARVGAEMIRDIRRMRG
jgi:hypothetical protein